SATRQTRTGTEGPCGGDPGRPADPRGARSPDILLPGGGDGEGGGRGELRRPPRADARHRGGVGLREERDRPLHPAHRRASRAARERAVEMLRLVGIPKPERRVDEYAFQLSGGLRQRAMIATALSCGPRILIADEPTTALDVTTQAQILDLLRSLQAREAMAVVLITHNLGVVAEMCDEVVVMYLGRVVERGPVDAIFHSPHHRYTLAPLP